MAAPAHDLAGTAEQRVKEHADRLAASLTKRVDELEARLALLEGAPIATVAPSPVRPNADNGMIHWLGSEEDEHRERLKACKARIAQHGDDGECDKDGSCADCEYDMNIALRVSKAEYDAAGLAE